MSKPTSRVKLRNPETLRAVVAAHGMSLRGLAREARCHPSLIDHLVQGRNQRVALSIAKRIAGALRVPTRDLFIVPSVECKGRAKSAGASGDRSAHRGTPRVAHHREILRAQGRCSPARPDLETGR